MRRILSRASVIALSILLYSLFCSGTAFGQTTSFTYQGRLADGNAPANGIYDLKFRLYDANGNPQGTPNILTLDNPGVQVTNGVFTVQLDFGAGAFTGGTRLLEISVRPHSADPNSPAYTTLNPRQPITSTPYAIRSSTSATADSAASATTAANFSGGLSGDVTGTQSATVVSSVGGQSAASVAGGAASANSATNNNTAGAIVKRDVNGNFSAGTITASLNGNASTATTATTATNATNATNFSGSLAGDVTGTQGATTVASVGGVSAANVASGATAANGATNSSTPGAVVKRDASGNFAAGTITATLNGNASTATSAASATNFSGSLAGDVTGTQAATVVSSIGGQSAANVVAGVAAANGATSANTQSTIVSRDASGNFSAGTITATLNGNASTATTATTATNATNATNATTAASADAVSTSAGNSVVTAINAGSSTINAARLPSTLATQNGSNTFSGTNTFSTAPTFSAGLSAGSQRITNVATPTSSTDAANKNYVDSAVSSSTASVVQLAPSSQQTATTTNALINLKLIGGSLGDPAATPLMSLSASGTYNGSSYDKERFRVNNDGGILAVGEYTGGSNGAPVEGSGTRFMWYPGKAATRAGYINGTQWDDANIGIYSTAFGDGARASGDWGFAVGKDTVAANGYSIAMGHYSIASGYASIALGEFAHTNARQGSFVFADRSYTAGPCDTSTSGTYGIYDPGCSGSGGVDTRVSAPWNNSFNVRASGGYRFSTNPTQTAGLRLSALNSGSNGGTQYGSFVWADRSDDSAVVIPTSINQTIFRSSGGFTIYTKSDLSTGVSLSAGSGSWLTLSDRNMKANFAAVNPREVLRGVLALPISTWNYKTQDTSIRHMGPMAQDFFSTFKIGENDKTIATIDPDGVALAAIQGLDAELKDRDAKIDSLQQQLRQQQEQLDGLKKLLCLDHPEAQVCKESK